jgi:hypothetical protein
MVRATERLEQYYKLYASQSDAIRQGAVGASDVEAVVAYANFIYDQIKRIDEEWSGELDAAGGAATEGDARAMQDLYAKWCGKAEEDLRRAAEFEARGERIAGLDRLRRAYYEARDVLSIPADRVRRAADSARQGRTRSLGEIRDELRRTPPPGS